jgi:hypothetical protein
MSGAGRGGVWTEERSDEGRRRTKAPAQRTSRLSDEGRRRTKAPAQRTSRLSDEGRRRTKAPRGANEVTA